MSLRLSLVIVLLALVGLHSSEPLDIYYSPPTPNGKSAASERQVSPIEDALLPWKNLYEYKLVKEIISFQEDASKCRPNLELVMTEPFGDPQFKELMFNAIMKRREFCFSRLEREVQSELDAMSESTREHFKLFAELDQRECSSAPGSLCFIFGTQNLVFGKLRRLIGSPKEAELEVARGFVSACKEVAGHARLATIRAKYEQATPSSTKPYYRHVRFYDFCHQLVGCLSFGNNCPHSNVPLEAEIIGRELGKTMSSEAATSGHEQEQSFFEAIVGYAKSQSKRVSLSKKRKWLTKRFNDLREECLPVLSSYENFIWLHQLDPQAFNVARYYIEKYSRSLEVCEQLGKIENEQIIKAVIGPQKQNKVITGIKGLLRST
jgi:hypothetical protein